MPVTFTNNRKNILDKLRSILRTEFKGTLPVYIGLEETAEGNQFIRINPTGSNLLEYNVTSESREFSIEIYYVFAERNIKKTALDHVLRFTSRIEALIHDNTVMTLADNSDAYNCRMESTSLTPEEEDEVYVVQWDYRCQHTGNIS